MLIAKSSTKQDTANSKNHHEMTCIKWEGNTVVLDFIPVVPIVFCIPMLLCNHLIKESAAFLYYSKETISFPNNIYYFR